MLAIDLASLSSAIDLSLSSHMWEKEGMRAGHNSQGDHYSFCSFLLCVRAEESVCRVRELARSQRGSVQ